MLNYKLGATGESLYDLTEDYIIANWELFTDKFRNLYRHKIY
jgi:hypothetical protein